MLHYLMIGLTWLIGIFGIAGAVAVIAACIWLGPAVVGAIIGPLLSRFVACTKCILVVVFLLATIASYWLGHHEAVEKCRADGAAAVTRNKNIDERIGKTAGADESDRVTKIEKEANAQHQKDLAEIATLKGRPPTCAFDDVDAGIAGAGGLPNDKSRPGSKKPAAAAR